MTLYIHTCKHTNIRYPYMFTYVLEDTFIYSHKSAHWAILRTLTLNISTENSSKFCTSLSSVDSVICESNLSESRVTLGTNIH